MINTDGKPTIASRGVDPLLREAIAKGGHLGDEVARVVLKSRQVPKPLAKTLREEHPELD